MYYRKHFPPQVHFGWMEELIYGASFHTGASFSADPLFFDQDLATAFQEGWTSEGGYIETEPFFTPSGYEIEPEDFYGTPMVDRVMIQPLWIPPRYVDRVAYLLYKANRSFSRRDGSRLYYLLGQLAWTDNYGEDTTCGLEKIAREREKEEICYGWIAVNETYCLPAAQDLPLPAWTAFCAGYGEKVYSLPDQIHFSEPYLATFEKIRAHYYEKDWTALYQSLGYAYRHIPQPAEAEAAI